VRRIRTVLKEIRIAQQESLRESPNIVTFIGYGWDEFAPNAATPCLVVEHAEYGNLRDYLLSQARAPADDRTLLCLDIASGLHALHACGVVHGDVKLENMLVFRNEDGGLCAKLADFGSAIIVSEEAEYCTYLGTPLYNPPEVRALEDQQIGARLSTDSSKACDVYAFGLLVWEACQDGSRYLERRLTEKILKGKFVDLRRIAIRKTRLRTAHLNEAESGAIERCLQYSLPPRPLDRRPMSEIVGLDEQGLPGP
jgi:serine/threonine protein kinase